MTVVVARRGGVALPLCPAPPGWDARPPSHPSWPCVPAHTRPREHSGRPSLARHSLSCTPPPGRGGTQRQGAVSPCPSRRECPCLACTRGPHIHVLTPQPPLPPPSYLFPRAAPCGHDLCRPCLERWRRSSAEAGTATKCPTCRSRLPASLGEPWAQGEGGRGLAGEARGGRPHRTTFVALPHTHNGRALPRTPTGCFCWREEGFFWPAGRDRACVCERALTLPGIPHPLLCPHSTLSAQACATGCSASWRPCSPRRWSAAARRPPPPPPQVMPGKGRLLKPLAGAFLPLARG